MADKRYRNGLLPSCALILTSTLSPLALADSPSAGVSATTQQKDLTVSAVLREVTVTAQRRSESLNRVPISISAFDGAQMDQLGTHSESDLQVAVPGLIVRTTAVSTQQNYAIRGQSIDAFTGSSPAVLAYVDEVEANAGAPTTFFDLSSIQVLKGPQGTLFGRNATGGAVLYTTTDPEDSFGGYATLRVGNLGLKETQAAVDLPVSERVLLRVAGDYYSRGGFQRDVATGEDLGGVIRRAGRVTLLLKPFDGLENKAVVEFGASHGNPTINALYSYYPCGKSGLVTTAACLFSSALDTVVGVSGAWNDYLAAHPQANPGGLSAAVNQQQQLGVWGVDSPQENSLDQQNWYATNVTTYEVGSSLRIKNIVGVSRSYVDFIADEVGAPFGISLDYNTATGAAGNRSTVRDVSEEVQALGNSFDNKLDYVTGLYYFSKRDLEHDDLSYIDLSPIIAPTPATYLYIATSKSEAAYAQGTYDLSSLTGIVGLKATGGVRYTWETDSVSYPALSSSGFSSQPSESKRFGAPSWQTGIEYQMTRRLLLYVTTRGSWRSGGFNGLAPSKPTTAQFGGNEYLPEKTHDVELGVKFRGSVAKLPAAVDGAIYNQWIENIQRVVYSFVEGSPVALTANIPAGEVRGVEFDGEVLPFSWLTVGINGAYTDAFYTNGVGAAYGGGALSEFHYGPFGDVSRLAGGIFTQIALPTRSAWGTMALRADFYAQSYEYFSNLDGTVTPGTRLPGYGALNLRYDWHDVFGTGVKVSAFAKNALNRGYYTGGMPWGAIFGFNSAAPAEPRTFGAELTASF